MMGRPLTTKYFGTDGIRGKANEFLSAELVLKLGRAAAFLAGEHGGGRMLIGMDTRLSGPLLESALAAGLLAAGVDVYSLGIIPTPGVAALCRVYEAPGAVISASHNPYEDNGIKFFTAQGNKLCDEDQERIEKFLNNPMPPLAETAPGRLYRVEDAAQQYAEIILAAQKPDLSALKLAIDCAHGAASPIAPQLLRSLGAEVVAIGAAPDGRNINAACGSTAPKLLCQTVLEEKAQIGMALDGDADRLIAVDETGNIVDGDVLLVIMARYLQSKGQLPHNTIVVTQMCNMALRQKLTQLGITIVEARVGDRYVLEKMQKSGALLGGEQSGHIILSCFNSTGDALAAAIFLLTILAEQGCSLASLTADLRLFAQVHINVAVKTKKGFEKDRKISAAIIAAQKELAGQGRVIVRASGTEPLFRVMTEGPDEEVLQRLADDIAKAIRAGLG